MIGWFTFPFAPVEVSAEATETEVQTPLAACRLQIVAGSDQKDLDETPVDVSRRRRMEGMPLADYQRSRGIDWRVPKDVESDDPSIRCLLMCPGGPYIVDLQVFIDGMPFRTKRERVIDQAKADSIATNDSAKNPKARESKDLSTDGKEIGVRQRGAAKVISHLQSSAVKRLVRYMKNQPDPVDRNEARWLLAQWTPGPVLLELRDGFAAERAAIAPVWHLLDRDQDGSLSGEEFSSVEERLISADVDEDEVVDMSELRQFAFAGAKNEKPKARVPSLTPSRLLVTLGDHADWDALYTDITECYSSNGALTAGECGASADLIERLDADGNQMWDVGETSRLQEVMPDLTVRIRLGNGDDSETGLSIEQLLSTHGSAAEIVRASEDSIRVELGRCYLELSAAQLEGASGGSSSDQVAIGAVMDGYPILRLLDRNNDRLLSLRECKSIHACLDAQDKDKDEKLTSYEMALPVRFSVTLGPYLDRILRAPAPPVALPSPEAEQTIVPPWFTLMDRNKDRDLSRSEFIGTRDQFKQLDKDGDGLLSVREARQFDPEDE